jgi:hypothetical protein
MCNAIWPKRVTGRPKGKKPMSVHKRGGTHWFKFLFQGQLIRESTKTNSKTIAREAERARRRDLELAVNRIGKRDRMPLFSTAAKQWLASKSGLAKCPDELWRFGFPLLIHDHTRSLELRAELQKRRKEYRASSKSRTVVT